MSSALASKSVITEVMEIPTSRLAPSPTNPRRNFPEQHIEELAESIRATRQVQAWESDKCPIDGNFKKERQYFFCKGCTWKLDKKTRAYLFNRWPGFELYWYRALQGLKAQAETTKTHG